MNESPRPKPGEGGILSGLGLSRKPKHAGGHLQREQVLAVVGQFVDRFVDVGERGVRLRLLEAGEDAWLQALCQLSSRARPQDP